LAISFFSDLTRNLRIAKIATWAGYISLLTGLLGDVLYSDTSSVLLIFALTPLLIFLPGLYQQNYRSLMLLCFVCLLYFPVIVANNYEIDSNIFDVTSLGSVVLLFIAAMMYGRWLRAKQRLVNSNGEQT
jgi:uncharacterized membrane protein